MTHCVLVYVCVPGEEQQQQKEDDDEDDEDEMPVLDGMPPSPAETRLSPLESENHSPREDTGSKGEQQSRLQVFLPQQHVRMEN